MHQNFWLLVYNLKYLIMLIYIYIYIYIYIIIIILIYFLLPE